MTKSAKLLHSVLLATALVSVAPFAGSVALAQAQVAEGTQVAAVGFDGNSRFNDNQLTAMVDVAIRRVYTQSGIATDIQTIQAAYTQAGYSNVTVTHRVEPTADGRVRVFFDVNEGDRAGIAAINFTGNNSISSSVLEGVITTKETHLLSWLFRDDVYAEDRLALDRERIRLYYANRGFPDARVLSAVAQFDAERNAYYINFTVDEGQRYNFGNIAIETSIPGLNADALRGNISTGSGSRYSLSDLSESTSDLAIAATNQGYPFAEVRPRINRNPEAGTFDVTYLVDEGPRIYVERINITGNTKTRDYVIRREFDFAEGDPFNRALVTQGRADIEALGFFQSVQVTSAPGSAPDRVVLNVAVVEGSTGNYGVGAGYSTRDGIFGEISLTERNFLGRGQYLRAAIGRSESGETYDFSFTEPRFMGLQVSAGIDLYRRVTDEGNNFTYGTATTGGQLRFGLPIIEDLTLTTRLGIEQVEFTDDESPLAPAYIGGTRDRLNVGYTLTYDTLDNQRRPTEGMILSFSQDYTTLTSDFLTTEVRARVYYPIWEEMGVVASLRGTAGTVTDVDGGGIHPTDAFQLGPDLVRGYRYGGMGARTTASDDPVGILSYAGLSAEVDFPLPFLPENWGLRGAVWGDAGWIDGIPDTEGVETTGLGGEFKSSVGGSLIWESPLGPLRGDFAHVIDPNDQDETQVFQLTLSTLF
ncbi:outer membrane protein assembly factor BamA [Pelagibacterium sp. 26DY04]|uniref:outer membrane protein assembly factor BamA n=1 Tax=Pelagibacterium sp. 26DY04 TaxID=2967130 RepID=UPI0028158597|nr:outer membrane protein assembly factor BamA [Pelagibacterium sp. 26DY04]WMT88701.1 outer membrane protein assembly factor BamA [Pelagibacterium sp. 26DY04]